MSELTINKLEKMPEVKKKPVPKSDYRKLLERFDSDFMNIAEIPVPTDRTVKGLRVGLGKVIKNDKREDIEVHIRYDEKAIIIKRKSEQKSKTKPTDKKLS